MLFLIVFIIKILLLLLFTIISLLISVAFFTLLEWKVVGSIQRRHGPEVGFCGLIQALADGIKLIFKEIVLPTRSNYFLFILAPILSFSLSFTGWSVMPFSFITVFSCINLGLIFFINIRRLLVLILVLFIAFIMWLIELLWWLFFNSIPLMIIIAFFNALDEWRAARRSKRYPDEPKEVGFWEALFKERGEKMKFIFEEVTFFIFLVAVLFFILTRD